MGKKKVISEEEIENVVLPVANDVLGIAVTMLGFDRILVNCQDARATNASANPRQVKKKGLDKAGRHRSGLSMGLPIRQARRHHMAIQRHQAEWLRKNGYLKI